MRGMSWEELQPFYLDNVKTTTLILGDEWSAEKADPTFLQKFYTA